MRGFSSRNRIPFLNWEGDLSQEASRRFHMGNEAIRVAVVGFSVVFGGLWILALGVKVMSFFCKWVEKKGPITQ
jgi:hypothetical protein